MSSYNTGYGIAELSAVKRKLRPPPQARPQPDMMARPSPPQSFLDSIPPWAPYAAGVVGVGILAYVFLRRK